MLQLQSSYAISGITNSRNRPYIPCIAEVFSQAYGVDNMAYANIEQYAPAAKRGNFLATIFAFLRAGASVRSGRKFAGSEPLYFHGNPRAF